MNLDRPSRRGYLTLVGGGAIGLAGCFQDDPNSVNPPTETNGQPQNESDDDSDPNDDPNDESDPLRTSFLSREQYAQPGTGLVDFESENEWWPLVGSMEFDTDVFYDGTQSLRLSASDGENIVVEREITDHDLTNLDFSFELHTTTPMNFAIYLEFADRFGQNVIYQLRRITYRDPDVDWFRTNPGLFQISDPAPAMDRIERIRFVVLNNSETEVWIDDLRTHEKPDAGYVILSWDDGVRDFYDDAAEMHEEFGYRAVQAPIPGQNHGQFMTISELQERQDAGDEIVMHGTHDPFHEYDEADIEPRLRSDKEWFLEHDLQGADYIIYPHNSFDATSLEYINQYHYCGGCNQAGDVNTTGVHGFDPLVLPRTIAHDLEISKRSVDMAEIGRNCTILNFHGWERDNTISKAAYQELLEHIDSKGDAIEVITFDDLWNMRMDGH